MIKGKLANWASIDTCQNLLFFAQLANEMLFDYSIPSNRLPTLNSHYLCYDADTAIKNVDNYGVPEGTVKPIIEELYYSLSKDVLFSSMEMSPLDYFIKFCGGKYRKSSKPEELSFQESKQTVTALNQKFFKGTDYFATLKERIIKIVSDNRIEDQRDLFQLTKSLLTELVNSGYHPSFLYDLVSKTYLRKKSRITNPSDINLFFNPLTLSDKKYEIIFIVKKDLQNYIEETSWVHFYPNYVPKTSSTKESKFLEDISSDDIVLVIEQEAYDPFSAVELSKYILTTNIAFFRLYDHILDYKFNNAKCGVYDSPSSFLPIDESVSAVQKTKTPSNRKILENFEKLTRILSDNSILKHNYRAFFNAITFHSLSLDSSSVQNQLLDLWAVIEALLDIKNSHASDRISQICKYLVPITKQRYLFSLFCELTQDIKNYSVKDFQSITGESADPNACIRSICCFVLLDEFKDKRQEFLERCSDFPLLRERIQYYNSMLSTHDKIYSFVEKHSDRVKWQIMRIYRNRNLVIHNGDSMPYLSLLVENLHSYVDDLLEFTISCFSSGHSLESMYQQLYVQECNWLEEFNVKGTLTTINTIDMLLKF